MGILDPSPLAAALRANVDTAITARLAALGSMNQQSSLARSVAAYNDNPAVIENWESLSNWVTAATPGVQVVGNRLYSTNQAGESGANRALNLGTSGYLRAVFNYRHVDGGVGGVIIGVSKDAPGDAPTTVAGAARGLYMSNNGVLVMDQGSTSPTIQDGGAVNPLSNTDYIVTVTADPNYVSVVLRDVGGTLEYRARWARPGFSIGNLYVFNSDANTTAGSSIGLLGFTTSLSSIAPRSGIEDIAPTVQWTSDGGNASVRVVLPSAYDSRYPCPLVLMCHGFMTKENSFADNINNEAVAAAFSAAGYIVLATSYTPNTDSWGIQGELDAIYSAFQMVRTKYAIGPVVVYGNSMGGLNSLLTVASRRIPGVVAWIGTSPVCNLANVYASSAFTSSIDAAYGITGTAPNDYATLTSGHDPCLMAGNQFQNLPMLFLAASDDVTVPKAQNTDVLAPIIAPYSPKLIVQAGITGGHSYPEAPYTAQMVTFANQYIG